MNKARLFYRRYPVLTFILFCGTSIFVIDLLSGIIFIPSEKDTFRHKHPYYHHGLKSNCISSTTWNGTDQYSFFTNSLGFRDSRVREVRLKSPRKRILFMGDSHVESVGVEYDKCFAGLLQSQLDTSKTEILNAGVVGYSPKLYYLKTKYLIETMGLRFDELFVFIDISDIQNELVYKDFHPKKSEPVRNDNCSCQVRFKYPSFLIYALKKISGDKKRKDFYKKRGKAIQNPRTDLYYTFFDEFKNDELLQNESFHSIGNWYLDKSIFDKWGRTGLTLGKWYMMQLAVLCQTHQIKMSVSVHPWPVQIIAGDWNSIQVQFWRKFAEDNHLQFIDFFSVFENKNEPATTIKMYFFRGDVHLNENGHKLFAEILKPYVE